MKNKFWGNDLLITILLLVLAISFIVNAMLDIRLFLVGLLIAIALIIILVLNIKTLRKVIKGLFLGKDDFGDLQKVSLEELSIPAFIAIKKTVIWYNQKFKEQFLNNQNLMLFSINKIIPSFDLDKSSDEIGLDIAFLDKEYTIHSSYANKSDGIYVSYFIDDTNLKHKAKEYALTRPVVFHIVVDTYEDVLKELKESSRARIMASLDKIVEDFSNKCNGVATKIGTSRYHIVIEERYFEEIHKSKFEILNKSRSIGKENSVTLSIGVGKDGESFYENDLIARQALDMALGRGGDQAVIKSRDKYEFFGGTLPSVEKRSRVRTRIIAQSLTDIIEQSEIVFIMGHKMSDLDAIGSAIGMYAAVESLEKRAYIVVDESTTTAQSLINQIKFNFAEKEIFITPNSALDMVNKNALLIVVDCHTAKMTESEQLANAVKKVVVVDHHRRLVDDILKSVVSYHEPYASSASELVSELIQYIFPSSYNMPSGYADALLSGIMLDTRHFAERCGVRTFEAAAYLRRQGANTSNVLKLFTIPKKVYEAKARIVQEANIYEGIAVSINEWMNNELFVAIPQAANDLLVIDGIDASIVAVKMDDKISISARSLGRVNVQMIMENLGGGGHLTMAGAQFEDISLEEVQEKIKASIDEYIKKA